MLEASGKVCITVPFSSKNSSFGVLSGATDTGDCFRLSRSLRRQGEVWIDLNTYDVDQLQWQLAESFSSKTSAGVAKFGIFPVFRPAKELSYEKQEMTIRFRPVTFQNPEQILLLPSSSESA